MGTKAPEESEPEGPTVDEPFEVPIPDREVTTRGDEGQPGPAEEGQVAPDPNVGEVVGGRYRLTALIGKGGGGFVFACERLQDGEKVALKVLAAAKAKRARIVQRFFDEVRAASLVQHPGLIRIFDFIEEENPRRLAYAMEYVEGEPLRARLKREGALDLRAAIHVAVQIADALSALHDVGIIHRDLKPENIMLLGSGSHVTPRVKLLDFGVVKFLPLDRSGGGRETEKPGTFVGTPRYMAPEQAAGANVDPRADFFALGVMLFEMITGRCPHEGDSLRDVVLAKLKGAPRITMNADHELLPQELTEIVDGCLQLKPALRPENARRIAGVLREAELVLFAVGPVKAKDPSASDMPRPEPRPPSLSREVVKLDLPKISQAAPVAPTPSGDLPPPKRTLLWAAMGILGLVLAVLLLVLAQQIGPRESVLVVPDRTTPLRTATSSVVP